MKKAPGRVFMPEEFRQIGNREVKLGLEHIAVLHSDEFKAWRGWGSAVGSLWCSRADARAGADAKPAMDQVRMLARLMRPALLAGDWQRARLHALEAENILCRLRVALLEPFAAAHAKVQASKGFHERQRFHRAIRELRARWWRKHDRELTHAEALAWTEKNPRLPEVSERTANEWISEVLGKRPNHRPRGKSPKSTR